MSNIRLSPLLKWAESRLFKAHHEMALSGALPDELRELEEIWQQTAVWSRASHSSLDESDVIEKIVLWTAIYGCGTSTPGNRN